MEKIFKWIEKELKHQGKTTSTQIDNQLVLSTQYPDSLIFGFKGDLIIIEFYEKDDKINESNTPKYKYDWCRPESLIRREIEKYINDILVDLKDSNSAYTHHIWWTNSDPYVWITGKLKNNSGFARYRPILDEVNSIIDKIVSYLKSEGFHCEIDYVPNKENCKQFYIYFTE